MFKFLTLTFLAACAIPLALAASPTRTFVARAYQSPYPIGQQLSGAYLSAQDGSFYVSTAEPKKKAELNVDPYGKAYLVRNLLNPSPPLLTNPATRQEGKTPVYLNTVTGGLEYQDGYQKAADGAYYVNFYHFGKYTTFIPPSALFQWIGSDNSYWFGCPVSGSADKYKIYKSVDNTNRLNNCTVFQLVAIDT